MKALRFFGARLDILDDWLAGELQQLIIQTPVYMRDSMVADI